MSKILELAQSFENQSKLQAENTSKSVEAALLQHEQSFREALKSSEQSLRADIQQRENEIRKSLMPSFILSGSVWLVGLTSFGLIITALAWHLNGLVIQIREQRGTLAALQSKTLKISIQTASNGTFLVLPKGADTTVYTSDDGRPAIKLRN